jgi:hypothetical protein
MLSHWGHGMSTSQDSSIVTIKVWSVLGAAVCDASKHDRLQRHIPKYLHLSRHCCESLKCKKCVVLQRTSSRHNQESILVFVWRDWQNKNLLVKPVFWPRWKRTSSIQPGGGTTVLPSEYELEMSLYHQNTTWKCRHSLSEYNLEVLSFYHLLNITWRCYLYITTSIHPVHVTIISPSEYNLEVLPPYHLDTTLRFYHYITVLFVRNGVFSF